MLARCMMDNSVKEKGTRDRSEELLVDERGNLEDGKGLCRQNGFSVHINGCLSDQ